MSETSLRPIKNVWNHRFHRLHRFLVIAMVYRRGRCVYAENTEKQIVTVTIGGFDRHELHEFARMDTDK